MRLLIGDETTFYRTETTLESYYFIKDHLARGRVEVCIEGQFVTICNHQWTDEEASVVCGQLKFSLYGKQDCQQCDYVHALFILFSYTHFIKGAIPVVSGLFHDDTVAPGISEIQCAGNEKALLNCTHSRSASDCGPSNDAGVVCQGD